MPQTIDADDELELSDYLRIVRGRWPWLLLPFLAVLAAATAFTLQQANRYCSTAQVLIADSEAQVAIQGDANVSVASRDLANEINVAYSDSVTDQVAARLGFSPEVEVDGEADSDILLFRACGPTADDSAQYANTWADVYVTTKQQQAADSIGTAVGGFEVRLTELRERRQEIRQPLDELEDRLARASGDQLKASLQTQVDRMQLDLAVELQLLDAQIQTIASNVTLLQLDSELARTGTARVMQLAAPPLTPSNAPLSRNLILGGVIGLILGGAAALLVDNLDRTIKGPDDVGGAPILGSIPRPGRELSDRDLSLATMNHTGTPVAEGYQKVRSAVEFALLGRKITSLLVTSPNQSEGKTTTSCNLAWAMSAVDHRVVLADVDFRRPRLHEVFGCRPEPGLSDNLLNDVPLNRLALRIDDDRRNMVIIPTGAQPPSPADFVASPAFSRLIGNLESEADLVILDSPPVLPVSDALSMARQVDAVIVVARVGSTSRQQLTEAVEALRSVGADVLGVCLIGVKSETTRYGYGYGTAAAAGSSRRRRSRRRTGRARAEPQVETAVPAGEVLDLSQEVPTPPQPPASVNGERGEAGLCTPGVDG